MNEKSLVIVVGALCMMCIVLYVLGYHAGTAAKDPEALSSLTDTVRALKGSEGAA